MAARLAFLPPPFTLANAAAAADAFGADILVLDYVQRIAPGGEQPTKRAAVDAVMDFARRAAGRGWRWSPCRRSAGSGEDGRSGYQNLGLASFKESGELEYGADDAFVLCPDPADRAAVLLRHVKSRHGELQDIPLRFTGAAQRFDTSGRPDDKLATAVRGAWAGSEGDEW
ncbi:MAG: hypothetical protein U0871_25135 [Gemmataceae bacterium]